MAAQHHGTWTIRRRRGRAAALILSAALVLPVLPAAAQDSPPPARPETASQNAPDSAPDTAPDTAPETSATAAAARLDFPAALDALAAEIAADPAAPGPRIARAALHMKMQRPALALADLGAVLADDPANLAALRARVAIWEGQQAWNRAREDLDTALAVAPGAPQVLALRGQVNARAGMTEAAQTDFAAALATAPGDPEITRLRDALLGASPAPSTSAPASNAPTESAPTESAPKVVFGEEAVMSPDFTVEIGAPEAPAALHIVHAAPDLAAELTAVDPALIDRAVAVQALRVVHLFTYTGDEASIWGSLALICAGPEGFAATHAALSDSSGSDALAAASAGDMAPLERLLTAAYTVAGIDKGLVQSCALDRPRATRYLADWHAHRDAGAWRGVDLLDHWPVWVLDGTPLGPVELTRRLTAMAPAPQTPAGDDAALAAADSTSPETPTQTAVPPTPEDAVAGRPDAEPPAPAAEPANTITALAEDVPDTPAEADTPAPPPETVSVARDETAEDTSANDDPTAAADPATGEAAVPPAPDPATTGAEAAETDDPVTEAPEADVAAVQPAPTPDTSTDPQPEVAPEGTAESTPEAPIEPVPQDTPDRPTETATETAADTDPARFPDRPEPVDNARVPVELRGIYAPSLAACLGYLAAIEAPDRIDAVLPGMNPLDGPALGTILVTSRRAYLFNALDTECAITGDEADGTGWVGRFVCASPLAPEAAPTLTLAPAEPDGTAPRVAASFGGEAPATLRQCRALGQLGNAFAPLWTGDDTACSVGAAVAQGRFAFTIDPGGSLVLRVAPRSVSATAGAAQLQAVIDGTPVGAAPGRWDGTGWQMSLGPFADAADRLGWGMFLDLRAAGDPFEARLPLFGSSAAMDRLETCAPAGQ